MLLFRNQFQVRPGITCKRESIQMVRQRGNVEMPLVMAKLQGLEWVTTKNKALFYQDY